MEPYRGRKITVEIVQETTNIAIRIRDEGPGFDVSALPDPTNPEFLSRPHGRGVMLMKTFFDYVQFNQTGNQVTMTKLFPQEEEASASKVKADS